MLRKHSEMYDRLRDRIARIPVIDTHEHMAGTDHLIPFHEPIAALINGYYSNDLHAAGADESTLAMLHDPAQPTEEKWSVFHELWQRTQHTAYARVAKLILKNQYQEEQMSLAALQRMGTKLASRNRDTYHQLLADANIRLIITDRLGWEPGDFGAFLRGEQIFPDLWRPVVPLPFFHTVRHYQHSVCDRQGVLRIAGWAGRDVTSLDEFLEAVFEVLQLARSRGAIALKDQCAYNRTLDYQVVARYDAERIFNRLLQDSDTVLGWSEAKPLDDFLFHQYMRFACELGFPVQIHTGHMAGAYNQVDKANVKHFAPVLDLHRDVQFDLFHGNYPYMGDLLFLAKNYPNVAINLCWLYIIDPLYARELLVRATITAPQSKVHGFGGDYMDLPEHVVAHLEIAHSVMAAALADLVEGDWLSEEDAGTLAYDWLFKNPNRFFNLGLEA